MNPVTILKNIVRFMNEVVIVTVQNDSYVAFSLAVMINRWLLFSFMY